METTGTIDLSRPTAESPSPHLAKCKNRWSTVLFLSVLVGSLVALAGVFTGVLSWVTDKPEEPERTGLVVIALVMLAFVAHCLDKLNDTECQMRQERDQQ